MYRMASANADNIIAFATDAIISDGPLDHIQDDKELGGFTVEQLSGITMVQAGVYWVRDNGEWASKYRGFDAGSLTREEIISKWKNKEQHYEATVTRFVTMGSALARTNFKEVWRSWRTDKRSLDIWPKGKRTATADDDYANKLCSTIATIKHTPDVVSQPYPIAWVEGGVNRPFIDGVDVRIMEQEWEDSYE
jgi:hypothetical protein